MLIRVEHEKSFKAFVQVPSFLFFRFCSKKPEVTLKTRTMTLNLLKLGRGDFFLSLRY